MLFVKVIEKIVSIGIASAYVSNERKPLSLLLLADPECGKTSILTGFDFKKLKCIHVFSDITKLKMTSLLSRIENPEKNLRYIIVPDFTRVLSHSKSARNNVISFLNVGIEEGLADLTMYYGSSFADVRKFKQPLCFGLATAMTKEYMSDARRGWNKIGFLSRLLPVSFKYTKEQADKIMEHLAYSRDLGKQIKKLPIKKMKVECSGDHVLKLKPYIDDLIASTFMYGFRYTIQFRLMLKAHALLRGAKEVTRTDVKGVRKLLKWVNMKYNPVEEEDDEEEEKK